MDSQAWATLNFVQSVDLRSFGLRDVAAIFGIVGSIYGLWKTWRYSKWQIAKRLLEYLQAGEKNILEARTAVLRHIRYGEQLETNAALKVHGTIKTAIGEFDHGRLPQAERQLGAFVACLTDDAKVGKQYALNANKQAATVLLLVGLVAKARSDVIAARNAWTDALQHYPDDADVVRCLGELDLEAGKNNEALSQFASAVQLAPHDKLLIAETSHLRATIFRRKRNPRLERNALHDAAACYAELRSHALAADVYSRAGEIERSQLNWPGPARESFTKAFDSYYAARDHGGVAQMRQKLEDLGEDTNTLPTLDHPASRPIPWVLIRISCEVLMLGAAAYFLFLTLR